ncbi:alpha/beta hydrolase [Desulfosarcina sp. OttesenSCG-928-A07]|nr:alpha/beta hydrolase [Desulfosarcina sp. OttesenSCG-928-A07]
MDKTPIEIHLPPHLPGGGGRLEAVWIGPKPESAPSLVLLHEGLGCIGLWRDFPEKLAAVTGCGVLVFSRLGYGGSDPCELPRPVHFMHDEGLYVLPEVIRQTGINDHVLIGHSDGGSIALIHAGGAAAAGLKGVITLAAHVFCEDICLRSIADARQRYLEQDLKTRLAVYHGANTDCAFWGWNDVWRHPEFVNWNIESYLPDIAVPVLAIQGQNDAYGTMAQLDAIGRNAGQKTGIRASVHGLEACGHAPHLEKKQEVLSLVGDFIRKLLAA